jgi:hypothetical protein
MKDSSEKSKLKTKYKIWNIWKTDFHLVFPEKRFFENSINSMKKLNKKEFDTIVDYKGTGFYMINKILKFKKLPLIIRYDNYNMKFLFDEKKKRKEKNSEDSVKEENKIVKTNNNKDNNDNKIKYFFPENSEKIKDKYTQHIIKYINNFDNIYTKMNTLPNITLYRGVKVRKDEDKKTKELKNNITKFYEIVDMKYKTSYDYKVGEIVKNDYFLSTSLHPQVAFGFAKGFDKTVEEKIIIKININEKDKIPFIFLTNKLFSSHETKGSYLKSLKYWNETYHDEFEILLPRNIEFKVIKKDIVKIPKKITGFKNIYDKDKYIKVLLFEVETLPYVFPNKMDESYFTEKSSFVCF